MQELKDSMVGLRALQQGMEKSKFYSDFYGHDDFRTLQAKRDYANLLLEQKQYGKAEGIQLDLWQMCKRKFGEDRSHDIFPSFPSFQAGN